MNPVLYIKNQLLCRATVSFLHKVNERTHIFAFLLSLSVSETNLHILNWPKLLLGFNTKRDSKDWNFIWNGPYGLRLA